MFRPLRLATIVWRWSPSGGPPAEKILVEEAPIAPYFQQFRVYTQDPRLVGVLRRTVGADPDFYYAKIGPAVASKK